MSHLIAILRKSNKKQTTLPTHNERHTLGTDQNHTISEQAKRHKANNSRHGREI